MTEASLLTNPVLCGADPMERIVGAELAGRFIRLFQRTGTGVIFRDDPFHPFILLEDEQLLTGIPLPVSCQPLEGEGAFCAIARFANWRDCLSARDALIKKTGKTPSAAAAPYLFLSDPVHQHLLLTGKTFFKHLPFTELKRLAIDIETFTAPGFEFSNPDREEDRVISVAMAGSDGFTEVLDGTALSEPALLRRLTELIQWYDPDVLEGHNLFRFDLEYLRVRAARHGVRLAWGRDGSEPRVHTSRFTVAERAVDYPRWDLYGRNIVDTYFLVQLHDMTSRDLESYGLKSVARHFGLAAADRVYVDGGDIARLLQDDPARLLRYNLDDARETSAVAGLLAYPFYLQTGMFPYSYQNCVVRGNATKINALFLREYLRQGRAIPRGEQVPEMAGGYTATFVTGVVGPILHCDVASLYPSIILMDRIAPRQDTLGLYLGLLRELRAFRLQAKEAARSAVEQQEREYWSALQQTFKVLINSFYGYLAAPIHNFADGTAAAAVTSRGRMLINAMLAWLEAEHARPVEVDTDGIYFIPPESVANETDEERFVARLSDALPAGIRVELAGRYRTMFSYKSKNYALLTYDGQVIVRGSALKSRGIELFLRQFMAEALQLLLLGKSGEVEWLYRDYQDRLSRHRIPIARLARTETLAESPATYREKVRRGKRNQAAAYELALQSEREYRAGDQISYYVAGQGKGVAVHLSCRPANSYDADHPDENSAYYLEKLRSAWQKFAPFVPGEPTLFDL
ncbi:DNA polymerase domain-containing protein [Geobacter argillaceus]|uniref:DNA-directed DNA polymerase n=1 Tax=Geobacter argillaceus TaxID=345631 RepID=A0A562VII0_9BACT|nr:DNA polymerase domain-containing protein [Geobacter argillaceus]TWJ17594.1 DNA polymerase elongation subunit (family B) [Geobacter argillaceus]